MSPSLKRKASSEDLHPSKHAKLNIELPPIMPVVHTSEDIVMAEMDVMDIDMDVASSLSSSTESSPLATPSDAPLSYPHLHIYEPILANDTVIDLYKLPFTDYITHAAMQPHSVKLLQPVTGDDGACPCARIPRLQLAHPTPNGVRKLWSICDQCGALGIVA